MIPEMTHELGRFWQQPKREDILVDEHYAVMSKASFDKLQEYNTSIPSGVYEGKMWKRCIPGENFLCWYSSTDDPNRCKINHRLIVLA